jgi:hypothetical protein
MVIYIATIIVSLNHMALRHRFGGRECDWPSLPIAAIQQWSSHPLLGDLRATAPGIRPPARNEWHP